MASGSGRGCPAAAGRPVGLPQALLGASTCVMRDDSIAPDELLTRIENGKAPLILDVRSRAEFARGRLPGARHVPFWKVWFTGCHPDVPTGRPLVVYCGHGPRARIAAAALRRRGFGRILYLAGHMSCWRRAGLPEER
jgi:rhodanese-related sulfurtransferase